MIKTTPLSFLFYLLLSSLLFGQTTASYTVQKGDTLTKIAKKFQLSAKELQQYNQLKNANQLAIGQILQIPGTTRPSESNAPSNSETTTTTPAANYLIKKGDTFYRIAQQHGIEVAALTAANPTINPAKIYPGQTIKLPSGAPTIAVEKPVSNQAVLVEDDTASSNSAQPNKPTPPVPEPTPPVQYKLVVITEQVSFEEFAKAHNMSVDQLNKLNGWNYPAPTLLASGSEAYVVKP